MIHCALVLASLVRLITAQSSAYGQCGGTGWTGATTCVSGYSCIYSNPYYSQCLPSSASSTTTTQTKSATSTGVTTTTRPVTTPTSSTPTSSTPPATTSTSSTPTASATGAWSTALSKAQAAVAKLSVSDKVNLATGVGWQKGNCVGNTPSISSINFPGLCLEDSPVGVRDTSGNSVFPAAINVAATFNRDLINARGVAMGQEFKGKGVNVALGPMMNLARAPEAGRNWEGFGPDPFLSGEGAYATIQGMQSAGVQACAKHFINNEQEHSRDSSSSNVDDRTEHELYLQPFLKAVQAGVASFMCSYNQINGTFACSNSNIINNLLKGELGFQGYLMSDWWATHGTQDAAAGLDMTMPGDTAASSGTSFFGPALVSAVNAGSVSPSRLNDMATRILAGWYLLGQDSGYPTVNFNAWTGGGSNVNVQSNHATLIRQIGGASVVLLKNTKKTLPLEKPASIAIIGNAAGANSAGINGCSDRGCDSGVLGIGWGSGTANYPYLTTPLAAITNRSQTDGSAISSSLSDTDLTTAASIAKGKSVAIVFITADSGEGYITVEGNAGDRNDLQAWHGGDALVEQVAAQNPNTIVVINSVGAIITEAWVTNPNVTAVLWMGLPGQEGGNGITDVLYGDVNPSGRLPFTFAKSQSDYSAAVTTTSAPNGTIIQIPYSEGLMIDYFHFDAANIAPRFEFGFGLSYTTFAYSGLSVTGSTAGSTPPSGPGSSLDPSLHNTVVTVTFSITNNGTISGTEIPQLYLSLPASANAQPRKLKGFESISLASGASAQVTMGLSRYDFSVWNTQKQQWTIANGVSTISIGASSRDLRLSTTITN